MDMDIDMYMDIDNGDSGLLRYDAVSLGGLLLTFRRIIAPPSSWVKRLWTD
jgi:hypothetical protein